MQVLLNLSVEIEKLNKNFNDFVANITDDPFKGTIIFGVILFIGIISVRQYAKK